MLLTLDRDQALFQETTVKLLHELVPVEELRRLRDDPQGFGDDYWRRGAELGWTSLLVSGVHGGGAIGSDGLSDLAIVAYEFGRHAAPGPLSVVNVVAATLSEADGGEHERVIDGILSGTVIATWCLNEVRPNERLDQLSFDVHTEGDEVVLDGVKRPVESGAKADYFLVTGRGAAGLTQVLVPADTPGLSVSSMETVDLTRRFSVVSFDKVRLPTSTLVGAEGQALEQMRRQLHRSVCLSSAEAVGTMQAAFDMTVEWAFDRYSFGRPLASYQELKHRFADMKTWLEASHAISDAATQAVASQAANAPELVSAAKAFIGEYGGELIQDCVQIHGGIGVTFDHDIHLCLRRHTLDRALFGTASEHRQRLADLAQWPEEAARA